MKIIYKDRSKHFLAKKQRRFATVISTDYVSLYSIDPDHLTKVYYVKHKDSVVIIPSSSVVKVFN